MSFKIPPPGGNFEPCPEFTGRAVCVDVTPLKKQTTEFGERKVFKIVFETTLDRGDGSRFCVWSKSLTPSFNEKANLRKLLKSWFGRDLTTEEMSDFQIDSLIGKTAHLVVIHEVTDTDTYANIASCRPDKSTEPLLPSGTYIRVQDRPPKDDAPGAAAPKGSGNAGYRRVEQPPAAPADLGATKVHVGRCTGLEVRDLAPEQVQGLIAGWLPKAQANPKPTADDRRLIAALNAWTPPAPADNQDDVPY